MILHRCISPKATTSSAAQSRTVCSLNPCVEEAGPIVGAEAARGFVWRVFASEATGLVSGAIALVSEALETSKWGARFWGGSAALVSGTLVSMSGAAKSLNSIFLFSTAAAEEEEEDKALKRL